MFKECYQLVNNKHNVRRERLGNKGKALYFHAVGFSTLGPVLYFHFILDPLN